MKPETVVSLLIVLTLFTVVSEAEASIIELNFNFTAPMMGKSAGGYDTISMDLPGTSNAGLPVLPFKPVAVLMPYSEELDSIEVIPGNKTFAGAGFFIEPGQAQIPACFNSTIPPTTPNATVYNSTEEFPSGLYSTLPVQDMCGYKILFLYQSRARYGIMRL